MRSGRTVLILGASASIGGPVVERFLDNGDVVVATFNRDAIPERSGLTTIRCDAAVAEDRRSLFSHDGLAAPVNVLISLIGHLPGKALAEYGDDLMDQVMEVNFTAQARLVRDLLPRMADRSTILLLGSVAGERGSFDPIYAAAKGAVAAFAKSLATWAGPGVRINVVSPSLIEGSTMYGDMTPDRRQHHVRSSPTGELLQPEDLAGVLFDLTAPHWRHVNGSVIRVNGGSYL